MVCRSPAAAFSRLAMPAVGVIFRLPFLIRGKNFDLVTRDDRPIPAAGLPDLKAAAGHPQSMWSAGVKKKVASALAEGSSSPANN
jgi:hypothetical protein